MLTVGLIRFLLSDSAPRRSFASLGQQVDQDARRQGLAEMDYVETTFTMV